MADTISLVGKILDKPAGCDAIHVAVFSAVATTPLGPGDWVGLVVDGSPTPLVSEAQKPYVGIVDPFLTRTAKPGEIFLVWLVPQTVTSLRHVWTHPAFPNGVGRTYDEER